MTEGRGSYKRTSALGRTHLERIFDLERLLDATLSGFADTWAQSTDDSQMRMDELGRVHQIAPPRLIADKRRANARRCQVLFAD